MADSNPDVTLGTLHGDLTTGFAQTRAELRAGFADLKATLISGFTGLPTRESSEEMVRLLRESNRLQEERFTQLDLRSREQHLATQHVLHSLVESHHRVVDEQRGLSHEIRGLSIDLKALIVRIDAIIRGRNNGEPTA